MVGVSTSAIPPEVRRIIPFKPFRLRAARHHPPPLPGYQTVSRGLKSAADAARLEPVPACGQTVAAIVPSGTQQARAIGNRPVPSGTQTGPTPRQNEKFAPNLESNRINLFRGAREVEKPHPRRPQRPFAVSAADSPKPPKPDPRRCFPSATGKSHDRRAFNQKGGVGKDDAGAESGRRLGGGKRVTTPRPAGSALDRSQQRAQPGRAVFGVVGLARDAAPGSPGTWGAPPT